jgi:hypothetical protein
MRAKRGVYGYRLISEVGMSDEFQAAALKSKDDGPTQAPERPSILPKTRIGSLFGLIYNSMD